MMLVVAAFLAVQKEFGTFDHYICRRDDNLRGRKPDEVPQLLRDALIANGVPADQIQVIPDEQAAVDAALRQAETGDLLLIFADAITRSWKQVIQFRPDAAPRLVARDARIGRLRMTLVPRRCDEEDVPARRVPRGGSGVCGRQARDTPDG